MIDDERDTKDDWFIELVESPFIDLSWFNFSTIFYFCQVLFKKILNSKKPDWWGRAFAKIKSRKKENKN